MSERIFDRETLLDISVNIIPLGIILFFIVAYTVVGDYPSAPLVTVVQMSIMVLTGLGLVILTYYSGRAISTAERGAEAADEMPEADEE